MYCTTMYIHIHTCLYNVHTCMYMYINLTCCAWQANTHSSTGCVRLDINLPAPLRSWNYLSVGRWRVLGVTKLYEPFPTPCLYVAPAANMVGRVPLIPLFLAGNSTPTIPHEYNQHKRSGFRVGTCDTAAADGRRGSNVYEVNPWLWQFGHGKPRLGGLSV